MHHIGLSIHPRWMVRFPLPVDLCEYSLLSIYTEATSICWRSCFQLRWLIPRSRISRSCVSSVCHIRGWPPSLCMATLPHPIPIVRILLSLQQNFLLPLKNDCPPIMQNTIRFYITVVFGCIFLILS